MFYELTEAYRLMKPVEQAGAWLYRVARNRIVDRFRKKKPIAFDDVTEGAGGEESLRFEDLLPSPDAGPEAVYVRQVLIDELDAALQELPEEQREVFAAHEVDGLSFKENRRRDRLEREHANLAQAVRDPPSETAAAGNLRGVQDKMRSGI